MGLRSGVIGEAKMASTWFDSRQDCRRTMFDRRSCDRGVADRRRINRRHEDRRPFAGTTQSRREVFRIVYPPDEMPRVLDADSRILDLSQKAVSVVCENTPALAYIQGNHRLNMTIQFRHGDSLKVHGRISRLYTDHESNQTRFICILNERIDFKKINAEQRYLLKHFPNFCRSSFNKRAINHTYQEETALCAV